MDETKDILQRQCIAMENIDRKLNVLLALAIRNSGAVFASENPIDKETQPHIIAFLSDADFTNEDIAHIVGSTKDAVRMSLARFKKSKKK